MGLEGLLRAFSAYDVFQLLSSQKKTGVLTIESREDTIAISFADGRIVAADSIVRSLDDRVGNLLVGSGKLDPEQLRAARQEQKDSRLRLAVLLTRDYLVSPEDFSEAMRLQICRIILPAFEWTEGKFKFRSGAAIDRDAGLLAPIPAEAVLKEVAKRAEEWPALQAKISSPEAVFRRVPGVEKLRLVASSDDAGPGALLVSSREVETWGLVDGNRGVAEIMKRAFLSDRDVYGGLSELLGRSLISQTGVMTPDFGVAAPGRTNRVSARALGLWAVLLILAASAIRRVPQNPLNLLFRPAEERQEVRDLFKAVSLSRLALLERSVRVYYDSSGQYPKSLEDLLASRVLTPERATDPYGRPYRYILRTEEGKFKIFGRDSRGDIDLDLSFERSLAPVSESQPGPASPKPEKQPGIQVIR